MFRKNIRNFMRSWRNVIFHFNLLNIPDGFEVEDSILYIYPETENVEFSISYIRGHDYICFDLIQHIDTPITLYEKNIANVEEYYLNKITFYIFNNSDYTMATWIVDPIEYSLTTNLSIDELKQILDSDF